MHCSDNQRSSQQELILTNKPDVAHDPLHATSSKDSNLKSRQQVKRGQILFLKVFPRSWCFHKRLSDCVTPQKAEGCDPLRPFTIPSRWTRGQHCCQISSNEPPCAACACLRSHRPTNPCWLHAHLPNHRTGNQLPRQPQSPRACLSVKTNPVIHFTCTTFFIFPVIHSFMNLFQHLRVSFWEQTWCSSLPRVKLQPDMSNDDKRHSDTVFYQSYRWQGLMELPQSSIFTK